MTKLNHFDESGAAIMVDVTDKAVTQRTAVAKGRIRMSPLAFDAVKNGTAKKGDVLGVSRVAGILATKRTPELIPMCHPLALTHVAIDFTLDEDALAVNAACTCRLDAKTGVEMEALTGVSVALLTIYDMVKAIDKTMVIENLHLSRKTGGKSGDVQND